jgi:hypothetical protein
MNFAGKWINTKNSVLELKQSDSSITGTFDSGVSDDGQVLKAPVVGWVNGDRITFAANYDKYGSVVTWAGQVVEEAGGPKIVALFLHVSDVSEAREPEWLWASTKVGADTFTRK